MNMRTNIDRFDGFGEPHGLFTFQMEFPMGLFDAIAGLQKMAEDPELGKSAIALGEAAQRIPTVLTEIRDLLRSQITLLQDDQVERAKWGSMLFDHLMTINSRLVEISLGLDTLSDPVKRPPFTENDVAAMMAGSWPPKSQEQMEAEAREFQKNSDLADDLQSMMKGKPVDLPKAWGGE